jgi:hypothetical protein
LAARSLSKQGITLAARRLYEIVGIACGLILLNYGFDLVAAGFPGTRQFTSQFLGANLLLGGAVAVFFSLYSLLKSPAQIVPLNQQVALAPNVGVGLVVEEQPPSQYGFYKNIEYVGYFLTALGLFAAVDLVLQALMPGLYNEARWWVEVLLVTFGVLSYAIFGSIGHLGAQEERTYAPPGPDAKGGFTLNPTGPTPSTPQPYSETLQMHVGDFSKSNSGEYERHLTGSVYDVFRVEREGVTVWREKRQGIRSVYLAGPYELSEKLMEDYVSRGEELKIGHLSLPVEALRDLMRLLDSSNKDQQALAS